MSKLPTRLQPFWPWFKRAHRLLSLLLGVVFRTLRPLLGENAIPRTATTSSVETARREPGAVTVHPTGPAETLERGVPEGIPADHWVFREGATNLVPARYVLEVADGRLAGDFAATITPGGVLDYQTSGYFGLASWREHPVFLKPTLGSSEHVEGTVVSLATRGTSANYYHFIYDAIARWGIFREAFPDLVPDAVIVPHQTGYQKQLLELAGIPGPYLQPRENHTISADRLLVPSTPNQDLDAPVWVVDWLRAHLPAKAGGDTPKRLYLSRGSKPNSRRFVREAELLAALGERDFVVLDPGTLSVQQQLDTFAGAEIVVAPHGAGLTNITWCEPGAKVLEMFAPNYVHLGLRNIAHAVGLDYRYLIGDAGSIPAEGGAMVGVLEDVDIPVERVLEAVDALLADSE